MNLKWYYFTLYRQPCCLLENLPLWGEIYCRVWLPTQNTILRIPASQLIPIEEAPGLPGQVSGFWSLWRIALHGIAEQSQRFLPIFVHDDGWVLQPTARRIWDQLLTVQCSILSHLKGEEARSVFFSMLETAEFHGYPLYQELLEHHTTQLEREREKATYAFAMRRQALERIGLPEVRNHRLALLAREEGAKWAELASKEKTMPEIIPLLLIRMNGEATHG